MAIYVNSQEPNSSIARGFRTSAVREAAAIDPRQSAAHQAAAPVERIAASPESVEASRRMSQRLEVQFMTMLSLPAELHSGRQRPTACGRGKCF